jgi:predicted dehydrogenase
MSEPLSIALIGCGGMMQSHVHGYRQLWEHGLREFRVVACCDVRLEAAESLAAQVADFQGQRPALYQNVQELLEREPDLQACDISVVHRDHHTVALPCLQAGKHVTIEKPLAITMRAGRLMLEAAAQAGVILHVAENYRRAPHERAINWALRQGRIGEPWMVYWLDAGLRLWYWTWREHRLQAGAGWTLDGGVHFADLFRYHLGPVEQVYAVTRAFWPHRYEKAEPLGGRLLDVDVEDTMMAILQFERSGAIGEWVSCSVSHGWQWSKRAIYGSEGCLDWERGLKTSTLELSREELVNEFMRSLSDEERELFFPRGLTDTVAHELKEFIDACLHGAPMETDGLEGYKAEAICYAVYESAATGKPVRVADVEALAVEEYQRDINASLGLG